MGRWLVWLGRIIGLAASAFFLAIFIGEGVPEIAVSGVPSELLVFVPLLLLAVAGSVVVLSRARTGGMLQIAGGVLMGLYHLVAGGLHDLDTAIVFGAPYIIAGIIAALSSHDDNAIPAPQHP